MFQPFQSGYRRNALFLAICATTSSAQVAAHTTELDTLVISSASQGSVYDVAQPVTVLDKNAIDNNSGTSLGTLLESTPGIANSSFGPGVGRPVIRGMSGSRVKILQNGSDTGDTSAMSSDHSPMSEASAAEQIEVIYGPATLLYGGGAIGGVVNVIDRRIHEQPGDGISGEVGVKSSSVDSGYSTDAVLDMSKGNWTLHLDGFKRDADDYRSGKNGRVPAGNNSGRIANSSTEGKGGAVALSWADGVNGFIGGSISTLEYDYGVPSLDDDQYRVVPKQVRYDLKGAWRPAADSAFSWMEEWRTELSYTDYEHNETEPGEVVGLFQQESWELQSRIRHQAIGQWQGTFGIQLKKQDLALCHSHNGCDNIASFGSSGWDGSEGTSFRSDISGTYQFAHSTPMPLTTTEQAGVFWVEQRDWSHGTIELGARVDHVNISADPDPVSFNYRQQRSYYDDKNFTPVSLSAAATWVLSEQQRLGLSLARVQRAPEVYELYWNGDHHATSSFQLDNPDLDVETAWTIDLNWLYQGDRNKLQAAVYHYRFDDYIYNEIKEIEHNGRPCGNTGDPFHCDDVYRYEQSDARFTGAEFNWQHNLTNTWHVDIGGDVVKAERTNGEDLPRTPPASMLLALNWEHNGWDLRAEGRAIFTQNDTAPNETRTSDFMLLNAYAAYNMPIGGSELIWHLAVQNLTDEYAVNHVSYLKQAAPLPGRNLQAGVRWRF
ncbi:TonB-dependent receptor [Venatoribacter cucullus]|uniref:TonB-dependent receptor n=1 Tax=Venatoribacter cucullus TaxID=2661630 RepID=UPI00223FB10C|nr:TonB-dependent receptor [Venatoribacter cucullus]UZK03084.1 TonB-dependent receptor [Venatoribacter cucullus]